MSTYILQPTNPHRSLILANAVKDIQSLPTDSTWKVDITPVKRTRSIPQNKRMWAMLNDVSEQVEWPVDGRMQRLTPEDWKEIFTAAVRKDQRVAQGYEGGFVMLGGRTSKMSKAEMGTLMELIAAFGGQPEHPVQWSDPT